MDKPTLTSDALIDALREGLDAFESDDVMDASAADGYLTGMVLLAPELSLEAQHEAYALIFSPDEAFEVGEKETALFAALDDRVRLIRAALAAGHGYEPIIFPFVDENDQIIYTREGILAMSSWATGFYCAVNAFADDNIDDDALAPILRHLNAEDFDEEHREEAQSLIDSYVASHKPLKNLEEAMYELVKAVYLLKKDLQPNVPVTKTTPDVGRNDPCPCGSGKKFKKCCANK